MHESSIAALVHVARVSGARLRELSDQLAAAEPRFVEGTLRSLAKEADALSAALARLAKHADALPEELRQLRRTRRHPLTRTFWKWPADCVSA